MATSRDEVLARVAIPFGAVVRYSSDGLSYAIDSGVPVFHNLEIRDEVWPHWMAMARDSAARALEAWEANPGYSVEKEAEFGESLQLEMRSAMAAICNAAFAVEAFSASVVHHNARAVAEVDGAAARIHQTMCRSFKLSNNRNVAIRSNLGRMFELRNRAVHAPGDFTLVGFRADFQVHVHPRFVDFSSSIAQDVVSFASGLVQELLLVPRPTCAELASWCADMEDTLNKAQVVSNAYYPF